MKIQSIDCKAELQIFSKSAGFHKINTAGFQRTALIAGTGTHRSTLVNN